MDVTVEQWRRLLLNLQAEFPPASMDLYVAPKRSVADLICRESIDEPMPRRKFLLVGARGGGKSTELRAIAQKLRDRATLATVDLDASGVNAATVSAFDLLYVSGLALLRLVEGWWKRREHYRQLTESYAGKERRALGDLQTALGGLAEFGGAVALAATTGALPAAGAAAVGAVFGAARTGLRLITTGEVVKETSPSGQALLTACDRIARTLRGQTRKPIWVLIDGLEKMNGEATARFNQIFQYTRLLANPEWKAVIAAPPTTLTSPDSLSALGYDPKTVWGFGPDDFSSLQTVIERRFNEVGLGPSEVVEGDELRRTIDASGGLPRHAILITHAAVSAALQDNAPRLGWRHIEAGVRELRQELGRGIRYEHVVTLGKVKKTGMLPDDDLAPTLFSNGRILAYPPEGDSPYARFVVHPLLASSIDEQLRHGQGDA